MSNLDNILGLPTVNRTLGRAAKPVIAEFKRDLTEADLALLESDRGSHAPPLKKIRDSHHQVARLLASGQRPSAVSLITGYSLSRISILQADPAFQELLQVYKENNDLGYADFMERLKAMGLDALQELHERLVEEPDKFSNALITEIVKLIADRTGFGPSTRNTNVNVNVDLAARLQRGRERADSVDRLMIDLQADEVGPSPRPDNEEPIA